MGEGAVLNIFCTFFGTPKLNKAGKNVSGMHANDPRFSSEQLTGLNPVAAPVEFSGIQTFIGVTTEH